MATPTPFTSQDEENTLDDKVKSILRTVLEQCVKESTRNTLAIPLEAIEERVSYYTAYPIKYLIKLHNEYNNIPPEVNLNTQQNISLLKKIKDLYYSHKKLMYAQIADIFIKSNIFDATTAQNPLFLRKQLHSMGYEYKNTTSGPIIVENANLRYERFQYLNKIIKFRSKDKPICHVEIRIIDKTLTFENFSATCSETPEYNIDKYYFLHAISRNGYISGIFCNVMDREICKKWITDILVTLLAPDSVLVLSNCELFKEKIKPITKYSSKTDMLQWLNANNIPCSSNMFKPELYELITKSGIKDCDYKIDHILKVYGHTVLRTPQKFQDLTPTELFWNNLRTEEYDLNVGMIEIKKAIEQHIEKIEKLKWELFTGAIANWEKELFEIDSTIDNLLDSFVFEDDNIVDSPFMSNSELRGIF